MENPAQKIISCIACDNSGHIFFVRKNGFDLQRCDACGHVKVSVDQSTVGDIAKGIYDDAYFSGANNGHGYVDYDRDKEPMRGVFEKYLDLMDRSGKLLDVGAATGFFADIARGKGFDAHGVEISDYAASLGRKKGLNIRTGTLSEYPAVAGAFDVITMWDVIEHFPDPRADIVIAHRFLKPGGILAINAPDVGSLYARLLGKKWHHLIPPEHLNFFNRKSMRLFLEKNGFEPILVTTIGKTFTLGYIFSIVSAWTKVSIFKRLAIFFNNSKLLSRISLPINLFDNMFVLARKKQ